MEVKTLLHEEITSELEALKDLEVGSDVFKTTIDGVTKLVDRAIDFDKVNIENEEQGRKLKQMQQEESLKLKQMQQEEALKLKQLEQEEAFRMKQLEQEEVFRLKQLEQEEAFRLKQMEEDVKDRFVKNCIAVAGIVVPSVITIWGTIKSIEFEKTGTITTIMGRGFINKLLPKK